MTKAITIRGAGMLPDSIRNTDRTIIQGWFLVDVPYDSVFHFKMEGVKLTEPSINQYGRIYNAEFVKCYIPAFHWSNSSNSIMSNTTFINCYIGTITLLANSSGNTFINSYLKFGYGCAESGTTLSNCIAYLNPTRANDMNIQNSILFYWNEGMSNYGRPQSVSRNSFTSYYCIGGCNGYSGTADYFDTTDSENHHLYNFRALSSVFKNFSQSTQLTDTTSFELQDSIATTILGNDGTQVGIYGGLYPFDPRVSNPQIRRINVANRSTADGKLSVDIEVVNE